jgi:hypothetical protein
VPLRRAQKGLLGKRGEGEDFSFPTHPWSSFTGPGRGPRQGRRSRPEGLALTGWPGPDPAGRGEWEAEEGGVFTPYSPTSPSFPGGLLAFLVPMIFQKRGGFPFLSGYLPFPRPNLAAKIRFSHSLRAAS